MAAKICQKNCFRFKNFRHFEFKWRFNSITLSLKHEQKDC